MARQHPHPNIPDNHPLVQAGFIHESTVWRAWGLTWLTWERSYRTSIPGRTLPSGRWFHIDDLTEWWKATTTSSEVSQ